MIVLLIANGANIVAEFAGRRGRPRDLRHPPLCRRVPIVAAGIWALVVFASYRVVERVFLSVAVVFGAYIVSAFVAGPDWGARGARALVTPSVTLEPSTLLLMVATVGTTVTPYMFFYLQSSVADKGLGPEELNLERTRRDPGRRLDQRHRPLHRGRHRGDPLPVAGIHVESAAQAALALAPVAGNARGGALRLRPLRRIRPGGDGHAADDQLRGLRVASAGSPASRARFREAPVFMGLYTALIVIGARGRARPGTAAHRRHPPQPEPERYPAAHHPGLHAAAWSNNPRIMGAHTNPAWLNVCGWGLTGLVALLTLVLFGRRCWPLGSALMRPRAPAARRPWRVRALPLRLVARRPRRRCRGRRASPCSSRGPRSSRRPACAGSTSSRRASRTVSGWRRTSAFMSSTSRTWPATTSAPSSTRIAEYLFRVIQFPSYDAVSGRLDAAELDVFMGQGLRHHPAERADHPAPRRVRACTRLATSSGRA